MMRCADGMVKREIHGRHIDHGFLMIGFVKKGRTLPPYYAGPLPLRLTPREG